MMHISTHPGGGKFSSETSSRIKGPSTPRIRTRLSSLYLSYSLYSGAS